MGKERTDDSTWLTVERDPITGAYFPAMQYRDEVWPMPDDLTRYATAIMRCVAEATHLSVALRAFADVLGWTLDDGDRNAGVADFGRAVRARMGDVPDGGYETGTPLTVRPVVLATGFKPMVGVTIRGKDCGAWQVQGATEHAAWALAMERSAELDGNLRDVLVEEYGMDAEVAAAFVDRCGDLR